MAEKALGASSEGLSDAERIAEMKGRLCSDRTFVTFLKEAKLIGRKLRTENDLRTAAREVSVVVCGCGVRDQMV